jgi:ribosomal protein L37E
MAMSKCRECGKAVSTLAKTCPSCGVPKPAKVLKKKTSTKKTTSTAKRINKNKEGIWAHCRNYQCRDYTQMYKIPKSYLDFEKCKLCDSMFMEPKTVNGKPLMPSDGIYDKIQNRIKKAKNIETHLGIKKGSTEGNAIGIVIMVAFVAVCIILIIKSNNF